MQRLPELIGPVADLQAGKPYQGSGPAAPETSRELSVCIATLTRQRPKMLSALLASWAVMKVPQSTSVAFVIVENDASLHHRQLIDGFSAQVAKARVRYVLEPRLGIPIARNRAIEIAMELGADLLLFVDDDCFVSPNWLANMVEAHRATGAKLIGGPVRAVLPEIGLTRWQRLLGRQIARRYRRRGQRGARRLAIGRTDRITILTNNWMAHRDLFMKHRLAFNDYLRFTGGSDTQFNDEATEAGVVKSWAAHAEVFEQIAPSRISLAYQYSRARDQSLAAFARARAKRPVRAVLLMPGGLVAKLAGALCLFALLPISGGWTAVSLARSLGWIAGRVLCLLGRTSRLYEKVTGE